MLWENYVFRRGIEVEELWDQMYAQRDDEVRPLKILYIAGRGFDVRATMVLSKFVARIVAAPCPVAEAKLLLVGFEGYELSEELRALTEENAAELEGIFAAIGETIPIFLGVPQEGDDEISATVALREGADKVLSRVGDQTDIIVDVSSLPRITYLTVLVSLLAKLLPATGNGFDLAAGGVTLQVLVGEDPILDAQISSEDPSNDLVLIPGYSEGLQSEARRDEPLVWFPILGENRSGQVAKIEEAIPASAEICPVLPHPSRNPRRADELMLEYRELLFARRETPLSNIVYVHEANPFEAYRQLMSAMTRYKEALDVLGGCRLVVTPLASKLVTIGSALACFEMKANSADRRSSVSIPYAEPKRYVASVTQLRSSRPEISALVLTGDAYAQGSKNPAWPTLPMLAYGK